MFYFPVGSRVTKKSSRLISANYRQHCDKGLLAHGLVIFLSVADLVFDIHSYPAGGSSAGTGVPVSPHTGHGQSSLLTSVSWGLWLLCSFWGACPLSLCHPRIKFPSTSNNTCYLLLCLMFMCAPVFPFPVDQECLEGEIH